MFRSEMYGVYKLEIKILNRAAISLNNLFEVTGTNHIQGSLKHIINVATVSNRTLFGHFINFHLIRTVLCDLIITSILFGFQLREAYTRLMSKVVIMGYGDACWSYDLPWYM